MCGIAGQLQFDAARPVDTGLLARMSHALAHRGPDDAGLYVRRPVGLAHRRLAILDLSPAGHQPMANDDRTVWIVFNGEIYNCLELRQELERTGERFRARARTPRSCCAPTSGTAWTASRSCAACSPSRSGTSASSG